MEVAATAGTGSNESVGYLWTKDEADKFKHKLNGLSTSVDILKIAAGVAAIGFTPLKIDAAILKVDEKGIVFGGVQKWTWRHARDEKAKLEAADKKLLKLDQQTEKAAEDAKRAITMAQRLQSNAGETGNWATDAEMKRAEKSQKKAGETFKETVDVYRSITKMAHDAEEKKKATEDQRKRVEQSLGAMSSKIDGLRVKLRELDSAIS
ncbi:hypothetical protein [Streptomyces sp. GQFP]|uniref:hypothetical protein n=1 Tax=Streptomyces sp. GQFP TaxID=2907545 RepID=UPI001F20F3C2|nr:hypothetical protein [Streptomyces sp. GQFP]UIX31511.1 hypothetical protein LUX31_16510 [Streptomyces sp. GQFP]